VLLYFPVFGEQYNCTGNVCQYFLCGS